MGTFYRVRACTDCGGVVQYAKWNTYAGGSWDWLAATRGNGAWGADRYVCNHCGTPYTYDALRETTARWTWTFWPLFGRWMLKDDDMPPEELAKIINERNH